MGTDDKKIRNFETIQHFLFPDKDHKKLLKTNKAWFVIFCLPDTFFQSQMGHMMRNHRFELSVNFYIQWLRRWETDRSSGFLVTPL